jgi:signal transduction histidine kinase
MNAKVALQPAHFRPQLSTSSVAFPFGLCLAYYIGAEGAFHLGTLTHQFAPFWPPNVVLFCALLLVSERKWWIAISAVLPAHIAAELQSGMPGLQALAAFVSNCLVAVLNAAAMRAAIGRPPWLNELHKASAYLVITVVVSPGLAAFAAAIEPILISGHVDHYWAFWWRWYLSNALGGLTLAPAFLAWLGAYKERSAPTLWRRREATVLALGLIATCTIAFGSSAAAPPSGFLPALLYVPIPLLLWAAVRFGVKGASSAIFGMTVLSAWYAMHGRGPFAEGGPGESVLALQLFLAMVSAPMLLLGALVEEMHGGHNRLSTILASISDCYFTLDRGWRVTAINPQAASWFGGFPARSHTETLPREFPMAPLREALEGRTPLHLEHPSVTHPGRWVELHAYPSTEGVSVFFRDITKRKTAELAARDMQELLQSTMDALSAQVAILDAGGRIVAVNAAWRRFADANGYASRDYGVGIDYVRLCEAARWRCRDAAAVADGLGAVMRGEHESFRFSYACHGPSEQRWFQLRVTRFGSDRDLRLVLAHENITEVKQVEEALQDLTGRLLRAQDEERRRIARELHDSTAQNLLGIALNLARLPKLAPAFSKEARPLIVESAMLLKQAQQEIRTFSYLLHPPELDVAGLTIALRHYVDGFARRSGIKVDLAIPPDLERLSDEAETALYRVVQEALANVRRHSGSRHARIDVTKDTSAATEHETLVLTIEDNGRGMAVRSLDHLFAGGESGAEGVGIAGMRQRLRQLGGRLEIVSGESGTIVRATMPLDHPRRAALRV